MPPPASFPPSARALHRRSLLLGLLALPLRPRAAGAVTAYDKGLLWRISRPGLRPSHVFGTVHLDDPRVLDLPPAVRQALGGSRVLLPELHVDEVSGRHFEAATRLPPGQSLRALLGEAAWTSVAAVLGSRYAIPPSRADRLKPWAAYLALNRPAGPQGEILDNRLQRLAVQQGLPVVPLESVDEQIASLEAVPLASQLALLEAGARRHDEQQAAIDELLARYLAEDLAGLWRLQQGALAGEPASLQAAQDHLIEHLLHRRNARMAERLLPQLGEGAAFAAFGALHLYGEQGVPARLARLGWRVERRAD